MIRFVIDYALPEHLNPDKTIDLRLYDFCKRRYEIIHGYDKQCEKCNMFDIADSKGGDLLLKVGDIDS